jgi:hypothetical protein
MATVDKSEAAGWAERVERLAGLVPGVAQYQDREGLRETDKQVRVYVGELLVSVGRDLEPAEQRLADGGKLDRLPALDRIGRRVGTLADRVRLASYGFAGVFALHKIREKELASLHDFDARLVEAIPGLQAAVRGVAEKADQDMGFAEAVRRAEEALQRVEQTLEERDRLAHGL